MKNNVWLFAWILLSLVACNKEEVPQLNTNRLYENLYNDQLRGQVKTIAFQGDVAFFFNCEGNLTQIQRGKNQVYEYQYQGDTIVNQISSQQRVLYILDAKKRVHLYISEFLKDGKWTTIYQEDWIYNDAEKLAEKKIFSTTAEDKNYFINHEKYKYDGGRKVEIFKYGKDKANPNNTTGLLRTETRLANEKGDWILISEVDEDGIPYRKSNFQHTYDEQGNWVAIYLSEENNYTGQNSRDTIRRTINYYNNGACSGK